MKALRAACSQQGNYTPRPGRIIDGLDLTALYNALEKLDSGELAGRRRQFNRLYQEALLIEEPGKGISFANMLLMLAQYKLVEPEKALK